MYVNRYTEDFLTTFVPKLLMEINYHLRTVGK